MFGNDLAAMGDGDDAADLLRSVELKAEPVRHVIDCGSKPWVHVIDPSKSAGAIWMDEKWALLLSDKKENGATRRGCAALEERALGRRDLVDETGARGLGHRVGERAVFRSFGADQHRDAIQVILRLLAVALLERPEAVILPGAHMV